jgi:hypothetical protein
MRCTAQVLDQEENKAGKGSVPFRVSEKKSDILIKLRNNTKILEGIGGGGVCTAALKKISET